MSLLAARWEALLLEGGVAALPPSGGLEMMLSQPLPAPLLALLPLPTAADFTTACCNVPTSEPAQRTQAALAYLQSHPPPLCAPWPPVSVSDSGCGSGNGSGSAVIAATPTDGSGGVTFSGKGLTALEATSLQALHRWEALRHQWRQVSHRLETKAKKKDEGEVNEEEGEVNEEEEEEDKDDHAAEEVVLFALDGSWQKCLHQLPLAIGRELFPPDASFITAESLGRISRHHVHIAVTTAEDGLLEGWQDSRGGPPLPALALTNRGACAIAVNSHVIFPGESRELPSFCILKIAQTSVGLIWQWLSSPVRPAASTPAKGGSSQEPPKL